MRPTVLTVFTSASTGAFSRLPLVVSILFSRTSLSSV